MDETTKAIIERITVRYMSATRIPSGDLCTVFYDCVRLSPSDLARLAAEATGDLPAGTFEVAVGIAYSGVLFAAAVAGGRQCAILRHDHTLYGASVAGAKVVVVDDVVHTGGRLREAAAAVAQVGGIVVGYACIIDRSSGAASLGGLPLWSAVQAELR